MIEFNGYIDGLAERFYKNNSRKIVTKTFMGALILFAPIVIFCAIKMQLWALLIFYGAILLITPLICFIPPGKKYLKSMTPKRIFTEDEYIVCQGDKFEEYNLIEDSTKVIDYGSFYHILFRFGKASDAFICQKELLTKGTLEEFEALFEGKIERRQSK